MAILDKTHPAAKGPDDEPGQQADEKSANDWTVTPVGQRVLAQTTPALSHLVRRCHGDTLVWAGAHPPSSSAMHRCMVRNRFFVSREVVHELPEEADAVPLHAQLNQLPLPNNSIDAFVLHHALETHADPRTALREVARVLHPGGRLVLCAFNPWSVLGLRRAYARVFSDSFSPVRFLNPIRLLDWLAVLGFELEGPVRYVSYGLPVRRKSSESNVIGEPVPYTKHEAGGIEIPLADTYVLSAVKQAYGVPPLRKIVQPPVGKLAGAAYPRVSAQLVRVDFRGDDR